MRPEVRDIKAGIVSKVRVLSYIKPTAFLWQLLILHLLHKHVLSVDWRSKVWVQIQVRFFSSTLSLFLLLFYSFSLPGLLTFAEVGLKVMLPRTPISPLPSPLISSRPNLREQSLEREGGSNRNEKEEPQYLLCLNRKGHTLSLLPYSIC